MKQPGKEVEVRALSAVVLVLVLLAGGAARAQDGGLASPSLLKATFGKLPIYFVENRGVYPDEVAYYIQGADKTLFFTKDGITFRLKGTDRDWVVKLEFVGTKPDVQPRGEDRQQAVFSYFRGPKEDWKTGLRTFSKIVYRDLWPGIDLGYRAGVRTLKYEFIVAPGADPARIRLRYRGASEVEATKTGGLRVSTPAGNFEDAPPVAWQEIDGKRAPVEASFRLDAEAVGEGTAFGFRVGDYDHARPLVLDPAVIVYCGYIGGASDDWAAAIAVDAVGNAYVTRQTLSDERTFPVTVGPDLTYNGSVDAFVAKVNAQGTALVYCGYIGGSGADCGNAIAVDAAGNAYVTGGTTSNEQTFPVKFGPDLTYNGVGDAFVAKVNPQGTGLVYCGYIGGAASDWSNGIAVDTAGNAYVTGETLSDETTFPVNVGPDLTYNGSWDAFVAKVDARGAALVYCGYIGGSKWDVGYGIAVDPGGDACVTGSAESTEQTFPVTVGPDLTYNGGLKDAFVAKVNAQGTGLVYCGYIGGNGDDCGYAIAVDAAGNAYVTGGTGSDQLTFPVTVGPDLTHNGQFDAFVAKVALILLGAAGAPRPGGTVNLSLNATDDAGLVFQLGTSLGTGPIPIDTRQIDLTPDGLLMISVGGGWPSVFSGYRGVVDSQGQAQGAIHIPSLPALIGIWLHTAFVTLDPQAPSGIKSISNTFSFPIMK